MTEPHTPHHGGSSSSQGRSWGGLLDAPPKTTFVMGFLAGLVVAAVIGGILTFALLASGGSLGTGGAKKVAGTTTTSTTGTPTTGSTGTTGTTATKQEFTITKDDHVRGDFNAPLTVVEFSDLECPFCKRFHPTMQQLMSEYKGKARWVYKHFPLDSLHPKADKEAEASECAWEQKENDGFWAYVDKVFEITPSNNQLDPAELPKIAEQVGLNKSKFETCLNSGKYAAKVEQDYQEGLAKGVTGTPGNFVNGLPLPGAVPYETLKAAVDSQLK